jgi:hypothetical protein
VQALKAPAPRTKSQIIPLIKKNKKPAIPIACSFCFHPFFSIFSGILSRFGILRKKSSETDSTFAHNLSEITKVTLQHRFLKSVLKFAHNQRSITTMKKVIYLFFALALLGGSYGYYLWNKPPESMANQKVETQLSAEQLFNAFQANEQEANGLYLGKVTAVKGSVKSARTVDGTTKIELEAGTEGIIFCELDNNTQHPRTTFEPGEVISIKGECAGMDIDGSVMLSHCAEIK